MRDSDAHGIKAGFEQWFDALENPLTAPDALGRETFARALTDSLARLPNNRSIVTAVFGPWGCGKTWLLERVVQMLEADCFRTVSVCRFSPWELKSHDQILVEFFSSVRNKMPEDEAKGNLGNLWERLEEFSVVGSLGMGGVIGALQAFGGVAGADLASSVAVQAMLGSLGNLFSKASKSSRSENPNNKTPTLAETKKQIAEELKNKLSRPILIVIDDLDRLTDEEIQLMIRLLNTTANLPNLHYLIFGDRFQISSALDPICGNHGDRYLEKLVQNSFQVPEPGENQVRLRLWEGLERIGRDTGVEMISHSERFSEFWGNFLKFRISNFRDCHRLLRTLAFHTSALVRDDVLEVDIMDLLAIDFLRVFDPITYHRLAAEIPTQLWCWTALAFKDEKEDSQKLIEVINGSKLGDRTICGALISIFPHLSDYVKKFLDENQLHSLRYSRSREKQSPLSVCDPERAEIYFRLDVSACDLPEAKVREFVGASSNALKMIKLLQDFEQRGWLVQLFDRLRSDPKLIEEGSKLAGLLLAVSDISDDLKREPNLGENELRSAFDLSDSVVERLAQKGLEAEVLPAIRDVSGLTLALYLIEQMRHVSDCTFFEGAKAPREMLRLPPEEIEVLSDDILPRVVKGFWMNNFIKQKYDPSRAYRMAHALGPLRTEQVLKFAIEQKDEKKVWELVESIAISIQPSINLESWNEPVENNAAGSVLLDHLFQFAGIALWESLLKGTLPNSLDRFSHDLIPHLAAAIEKRIQRGPDEGRLIENPVTDSNRE